MDIYVDDAALAKVHEALKEHPERAKRALIRTMNDTMQRTQTKLKKNITALYNIKQKDLNGGNAYKGESSNNLIKVKKVNDLKSNAEIEIRGGYLTLYRFTQGNRQPNNKKGAAVKVKVRKSNAVKMSNVNFINYPRGNKNNLQVFQRHRSSRDISRVLKTISVAHMASNEEVATNTQQEAQTIMQERAEHNLKRELQKIK